LHINDAVLNKEGSIDQEKLDLVARAGGSYYSRAKAGFFEIPKPLSTLGIGVDALPKNIKSSNILTGNDLGLLGNVEALPTKEAIIAFAEKHDNSALTETEKHSKAQNLLSFGNIEDAWKVLLS
jgi:hypothetical protein